jgi:hypothetical protein
MPIQNGRYVSPTWVNGGPPPIDQTELQAITDTLESLDSGTGGGGGKRYATLVVGTSTNGWTTNDCDYLCDGVDDQMEINQAITSLPNGGGEIILLDGLYYLSSYISLSVNTKLTGTNKASVGIKRMSTNGYESTGAMIVSPNDCCVSNMYYNGNSSIFTSGASEKTCEILAGGGARIENVSFSSCVNNAIYAEPIAGDPMIVSGCSFYDVKGSCVYANWYGTLIFENSYALTPAKSILTAVGEEDDGSAIQTPLTIIMENVTSFGGNNDDIIMNGTGFCKITNCDVGTIQITNTVSTGPVAVERGRHILLGNTISPTSEDTPSILFGNGVNNCLAIGNTLQNGSMPVLVQDDGQNNIIFNGSTAGEITLSVSGWSGNTQTVQAPGVTFSSSVVVGPDPSSMNSAMQAGVYCSAQGNGTLTFTCSTIPSSSLTYNYTTQGVF